MSGAGWAAALHAGLRMGIAPEAFWRLSVREWRMLTGTAGAMRREELAALMARYPDGAGAVGAPGANTGDVDGR